MKIKRGEIYLARLHYSSGSEQMGVRPVLIIQNNTGNKHSSTVIVACITSRYATKHRLPTHYPIPQKVGLKYPSIVMMEQIMVIDKTRLFKYIGKLSFKYMKILDKRIMISLGLSKRY